MTFDNRGKSNVRERERERELPVRIWGPSILPGLSWMPEQFRSTHVSHSPTFTVVPFWKVLETQNGATQLTNSRARPRMERTNAARLYMVLSRNNDMSSADAEGSPIKRRVG